MINREEALELLRKYIKTKNLIKHSYAVEAILGNVATCLGENQELWTLTGLLHDLDYDLTKETPEQHSIMTVSLLEGLLPPESINAIKSHNYQYTMQVPETTLDKSLIAADAVSGLVIAAALVMPTKKLQDVQLKTVLRKFKDSSFAAGCNRKRIILCEDVDVELSEFLQISLSALQNISSELGL